MNWRLAVIPVTLIPIIIIAIQFDIEADDIFAIGVIPFTLAVIAIMAKLGLQGLKLAYIARTFLGPFDSIKRLTAMRVGSEFIKFTTPMFVGAEFAVIYYMTKKGIPTSKASWVALLDIVTEVFAAGVLSILAGILAIMYGAYVVGAVVLGTAVPITGLWIVLFFLSSKRTFTLPRVISFLATTIGKERGEKYVKQTNGWIEEVCVMSRENLHSSKSKKTFTIGFFVSIVSWMCYGISFLVIANGVGYAVEFFDSIMAVMGANAIANLPITVGGSGLAEFGIIAYLNNLDPFNFSADVDSLQWNAVIGWRIATYYIPIAVTWILLVKLALSKISKPNSA